MAIVFLSLSLLGALSWAAVTALDYGDTLERSRQDARQAAALLDGHARAVLEPGAGLLARIADRMDGIGLASWSGRDLGDPAADRNTLLTVLDSRGAPRSGPAVTFEGNGFPALATPMPAEAARSLLVGTGRVAGERSLLLARRIHTAGGRFDGAVVLAVPVAALSHALNAFGDGLQRSVGLFGLDGMRLAGFGVSTLGTPPPLPDGTERIEADWFTDGQPSVVGLKRMRHLPILAAVAIPRATVLAPWYVRLERGLAVTLIGFAALASLSLVGFASLRREASARRDLTDANAGLEQRVEERTAALSTLNQKLSRALDEKERANQAKGRFLSAANHDLRQPFQALRLFHHILMERLTEPRDRVIAEKMGEALDAGENLLHALLEVATLDAGVVRPQLADVPVAAVVAELVDEFQGTAADKGLRLRAMPCRMVIRTDRGLLTRMLRDLLRNAVRFTDAGRVTIGCRRRGQWLRIEVWDTGSGIPAEQFDNIFEDFVQLGNPERDRRQGLGLGLARVRRKAALLGHALELQSHPGRGSVFAVHVPVVGTERAAVSVALSETGLAADPGERLILVIEDDPVQRDGMRLLLESWGHRVIEAVDGEAALSLLRPGSGPEVRHDAGPAEEADEGRVPDMVVSDFRLPGGLNGVQAVSRIGEQLGQPIPGLILTGDTAPERIREAVATGCRLLHKPVAPEHLRDAITAVLSDRAPLRSMERSMETQGVV